MHRYWRRVFLFLATPAGLEPATYCLEGSCSIQLSYGAGDETLRARVPPDPTRQCVHGPTRLNLKLSEYDMGRRFTSCGSSTRYAMPSRSA